MYSGSTLKAALAGIAPKSFDGRLARRVGFGALLSPIKGGGGVADIRFLYAGRRRNRFTPQNGPQSIYFGEDEEVGSAEVKRVAFLDSFAKKSGPPSATFWARVSLPDCVLDLTDSAVIAALGSTDLEIYNPDWRDVVPRSPTELLASAVFQDGRFAAIKYFSVRMREAGKSGICFCIFKTRVKAPASVRVSAPDLGLDENWP